MELCSDQEAGGEMQRLVERWEGTWTKSIM